jgi:hypothetical protein
MSNDMKELTEGKETITNEIRGHKANLSNPSESDMSSCCCLGEASLTAPDTSEGSKKNSKEVLKELGGDDTIEAHRNKPISKDAAENLYGSRAAAG